MASIGDNPKEQQSLTGPIEVDFRAPAPNSQIGVEAINADGEALDGSGDPLATAGTVLLFCKSGVLSGWSPIYESDGTTQASIDLTDPEPVGVSDFALFAVRAEVGDSITGPVTGLRLAVKQTS